MQVTQNSPITAPSVNWAVTALVYAGALAAIAALAVLGVDESRAFLFG
jgi:hypothetical protein